MQRLTLMDELEELVGDVIESVGESRNKYRSSHRNPRNLIRRLRPQRRRSKVLLALGIVLVLMGTYTVLVYGKYRSNERRDQAAVEATSVKAEPGAITDGIWTVGSEVQPGKYTVRADQNAHGGYFVRYTGPRSDPRSIAQEGIVPEGKDFAIEIQATDHLFKTSGGLIWHKVE